MTENNKRLKEYKDKVSKMSNKQLLVELDTAKSVQTFPFDNHFGYDMERIVTKEILKRMNKTSSYSNYINRYFTDDGNHIYRPDGYSRNME